jgi:hypothetical protein
MDNQFSVLIFRVECSVTTRPDSKSVVLESLYYRFQICIGKSTSGVGRWLTLDSMPDLVQVGKDVFAGIWNGPFFEIGMSTVFMLTKCREICFEPANLSVDCNGTVDIGLRAKNTSLNSRCWLTWIFRIKLKILNRRIKDREYDELLCAIVD